MNGKHLYDAFAKIDEKLTDGTFAWSAAARPRRRRTALIAAAFALLVCAAGAAVFVGETWVRGPAGTVPVREGDGGTTTPAVSGAFAGKDASEISVTRLNADLMAGIVPREVDESALSVPSGGTAADFAVELFRLCREGGKNNLVSPISVLSALAMTANGAENDTRSQMEAALGASVSELNAFFMRFNKSLSEDENGTLKCANSLWLSSDRGVGVKKDFLQTNADFYSADVFGAPFDDGATVDRINAWVKANTDGMIPNVVDSIPDQVVMYLINAVAFDAKWEKPFEDRYVHAGSFTTTNNRKHTVSMMHSQENLYLTDGKTTGFIKPYEGGRYAFAALLPEEGVRIGDFIASLDGASLNALIQNPTDVTVHAAVPSFKTEQTFALNGVLKKMGMTDAFDRDKADFSALGSAGGGRLFIDSVTQKTFIDLNTEGTRAAAATSVAMSAFSHELPTGEKEVILDRPFVYLLLDLDSGAPLFIGSVETF